MKPAAKGSDPIPEADLSPAGTVFRSSGAMPTVTLRLGPGQHWVKDSIPIMRMVDVDAETIEVTLAVASSAFLERLLLQLGPTARVIGDNAGSINDLAAAAARRVLENYAD